MPAAVAHPPHESARVALLLSAAGGFLDAFTWIGHGGVFANAQTGNVVLLGVYAAQGDWARAGQHVPPIVAFLLGIGVAYALRRQRSVALASLGLEILLLALCVPLPPTVPDMPIVLGIAFVAALQTASFARVEGNPYSSVMTTGNLRRTAEAALGSLIGAGDPAARRQAIVFALVCAAFGLGAAAGALATARLGNAALVVPIAMLGSALALCLSGTKKA